MAHFEVPVVRVSKVENHPFADRLTLNYFKEFVTISGKLEDGSNRYNEGDLVVYVPEGAVVPDWLLKDGFWDEKNDKGILAGSKGNRVKAIRLRQIISQGIMFPVESQDDNPFIRDENGDIFNVTEDQNVADILKITKYEPPIPTSMSGEVIGIGPQYTVSFDVENMQRYSELFSDGDEVIISEKNHGTCCQIYFNPSLDHGELWDNNSFVASKGLGAKGIVFKNTENNASKNVYTRIMNKVYNKELFENLFGGKRFALFGEIVGRGIQDLDYGFNDPTFLIFDVWVDGNWMDWDTVEQTAAKINIQTVPFLYRGKYHTGLRDLKNGNSTLANHIREGIVIKHTTPRYDQKVGRIILKDINPEYLLRKNGTEYS